MDFIGLNYYTHLAVRFQGYPDLFEMLVRTDLIPTGLSTLRHVLTKDMNYGIYAEGMYRALKIMKR